jgi:hypothetical protein
MGNNVYNIGCNDIAINSQIKYYQASGEKASQETIESGEGKE